MFKKNNDLSEILKKIERFCAYQERSQEDVIIKMNKLNIDKKHQIKILEKLSKEDYIDEIRFAKIFCRSKFNNNKWGKRKIKQELIQKKVSEKIIKIGLKEIDDKEYLSVIKILIKNKVKKLNEKNTYIKKQKIAKFLNQKGFESDVIWKNINILT